jgi:putative tryptophan/tyrosine transport system substrate-binding protein
MNETGDHPYYPALFKELRRREDRYPELCRDVVGTKPDVIVTSATRLVLSFKAATHTIPIVAVMADPVPYGVVSSIARPGGNITGVSVEAGIEIWGKRLEVLREVVPAASKVGFLGSRKIWELPGQVPATREAAAQAGITLLGPPLESLQEGEYRRVAGAMARERVDGIIVGDQLENVTNGRLIVSLAENARLPTVFPYREYFEIGALMAYGPSLVDIFRRLAGYVDRILNGTGSNLARCQFTWPLSSSCW